MKEDLSADKYNIEVWFIDIVEIVNKKKNFWLENIDFHCIWKLYCKIDNVGKLLYMMK
jgi:hypothetical protein